MKSVVRHEHELAFLLLPDTSSAFYDQPYVRRAKKRLFILGAITMFVLQIVSPSLERLLNSYYVPGGPLPPIVQMIFSLAGIMAFVVSQFAIYYALTSVIGEWQRRLLPEVVQSGQSVVGVLIHPAQGFAYGTLLGGFSGFVAGVVVNPSPWMPLWEQLNAQKGAALVGTILGLLLVTFFLVLFSAVNSWVNMVAATQAPSFFSFLWRYIKWQIRIGLVVVGVMMPAAVGIGFGIFYSQRDPDTGLWILAAVGGYALIIMPLLLLACIRAFVRLLLASMLEWEKSLGERTTE